jgi:hypothetical protein
VHVQAVGLEQQPCSGIEQDRDEGPWSGRDPAVPRAVRVCCIVPIAMP